MTPITFQSHATRNTGNRNSDWSHEPGGPYPAFGTLTLVSGESRPVPQVAIGYLRAEFPSVFVTNVTNSLAQFFLKILPKDPRIEHVYWFSEDDVLKVWTIIPEPDFALEAPIYDAQMLFIEKFPEYACDFSVIYRFGKSLADIEPQGAHRIL